MPCLPHTHTHFLSLYLFFSESLSSSTFSYHIHRQWLSLSLFSRLHHILNDHMKLSHWPNVTTEQQQKIETFLATAWFAVVWTHTFNGQVYKEYFSTNRKAIQMYDTIKCTFTKTRLYAYEWMNKRPNVQTYIRLLLLLMLYGLHTQTHTLAIRNTYHIRDNFIFGISRRSVLYVFYLCVGDDFLYFHVHLTV